MTSNSNYDVAKFFNKNYNKPKYKEEQLFKQQYSSVENFAQTILKSDIKRGLNMSDKNDIEWRKKVFGKNEYFTSSEKTSFFSFLSMSFDDPIIVFIFFILIILIIVDCLKEGIRSGYKEGLSIIISLLIYLSLNAYKDFNSKNKTIEYDKVRTEKKCKVIRNNKEQIISNRDILVGDLLVVNKGDLVEVDGFYVKEKKIGIDESPIFEGENRYKVKYKSNNFMLDNEKNDYICPFIFAGTYVVDGSGYMIVGAVGKNLYKNNKMISEVMEERIKKEEKENEDDIYEDMELNQNEEELDEYFNNYGFYKLLISALTEQISSIGFYFFMLLGFIIIIKKTTIRIKEKHPFISLEEVDIIINGILISLIGSIFCMINSLFMIDLIGFLSDQRKMKKNNIVFKYEKYSELAFIDTLVISDRDKPMIPGDTKNIETNKIIQTLKLFGVRIIFLSESNLDDSISKSKEMGIIHEMEIEEGKKILKKCKNLVKENLFLSKESPIFLEGNIFYSLCGEIEKEKKESGNVKIKFTKIDHFKNVVSNLKIISNITKEEKLILISGLKQIGKVMAITGIKIEDLNLMKLSNFSFGNNEDYDILKDNYSLTLLDNSLNSFWKAYIYSTNLVYKILQYLMFYISTFFTVLIINTIGIVLFRDVPINIIEMIYIILIIDLTAPNGVVEGNFCQKLLTYEKFSKNTPFVNNKSLLNIIIHVFSRVIVIVFLMVRGNPLFNIESDQNLEHNIWNETNGYHLTVLFCVLFFMILIHLAFVVIETNKNYIKFGFNICIMVIIQLLIVNYGGKITRTKKLSQNDLIKCFEFASFVIPIDIICKIITKQ